MTGGVRLQCPSLGLTQIVWLSDQPLNLHKASMGTLVSCCTENIELLYFCHYASQPQPLLLLFSELQTLLLETLALTLQSYSYNFTGIYSKGVPMLPSGLYTD
jgi:hypothetical protein